MKNFRYQITAADLAAAAKAYFEGSTRDCGPCLGNLTTFLLQLKCHHKRAQMVHTSNDIVTLSLTLFLENIFFWMNGDDENYNVGRDGHKIMQWEYRFLSCVLVTMAWWCNSAL